VSDNGVGRYRVRPVEFEAIKFTGHNDAACLAFCPFAHDSVTYEPMLAIRGVYGGLKTEILVFPGDWILKDANGHFSRCTDYEFHQKYERVTDRVELA
jgi:hypothetical protein